MELGIIVDVGHMNRPQDASYWMEGNNEKNLSDKVLGSLTTEGKDKYYISAFRCTGCGFLKFYAGPDNSETKK
jgi:hypothetical protein